MSVFMCYSNLDSKIALSLRNRLVKNDITVWMDQVDIIPGANWQQSIEATIKDKNCSHMIVLLSKNSITSSDVEAEWNLAKSIGKTIVPVLIDRVEVPYRLRSYQFLNYCELGIEKTIDRLVEAIPKTSLPKHRMFEKEVSFWFRLIQDKYTTFYIDFGPSTKRQFILMNPNAYHSIQAMLDDLFTHYLSTIVAPYSYGSEWVLVGEPFRTLIAVPWEWVCSPGESITELNPNWAVLTLPSQQNIRPNTYWEICTKEGCTRHFFQSFINKSYAIASNNAQLVNVLLSNAKAISLLYRDGYFNRRTADEVNACQYSYIYVFHDWLEIGLKGSVLKDANKKFSQKHEAMFKLD